MYSPLPGKFQDVIIAGKRSPSEPDLMWNGRGKKTEDQKGQKG